MVFATSVGAIALLAWWVVNGENSPCYEYFLYHHGGEIDNLLTRLNWPAVLVGFLISGNVHQPSEPGAYAAMFVQWFIIGWLVSIPIFLIFAPSSRAR
jgi:hypothetical protein